MIALLRIACIGMLWVPSQGIHAAATQNREEGKSPERVVSTSAKNEVWTEAFRQMPLSSAVMLNRDNAIPVLLDAFTSNAVVKALLFLPAVSDDFYLINRDKPRLNIVASNLLDAILALTNATGLRVTFHAPFLLLHLPRDILESPCVIRHAATAQRLQRSAALPHALFKDTHWEKLQPVLEKAFGMEIRPGATSEDAWHFNRHNFSAWGLSNWETLKAVCWTGKTRCIVEAERLVVAQAGER